MADPLPGPFGKSWFTLELDTKEGVSWFELTLDTTAPVLQFGSISGQAAGQTLTVPYTTNESGYIWAELISPTGTRSMTVDATSLRIDLPESSPTGNYQVRVHAMDEVWNERTYLITIPIQGAETFQPDFGGSGHAFTYGPLIRKRQRISVPAQVDLAKQVRISVDAEVDVRQLKPVLRNFIVPVEVPLARQVRIPIAAIREPGTNLSKIVSEDEYLLFMN